MEIRALVFDFDGVILETEGPIFQSWQEVFASFGGHLPLSVWAQMIGTTDVQYDPFEDLERQAGHPVTRSDVEAARRQRETALVAVQPVLPGVKTCIEDARRLGLRVGLASSSPAGWVHGHLRRLGLFDQFECIRTATEIPRTKPEPDLYLAVLDAFGLQGSQAIALEDSPNGITAARRAGLFTVAIPSQITRQLPIAHAHLQIPSLAAMPLPALLALAANGRGAAR